MMKKKLLHYLPVMIAAALFVLCLAVLGIYDKTSVPLATVSFSAEIPTDPEDELLGALFSRARLTRGARRIDLGA